MYDLKERISKQKGLYQNRTARYLLPLLKVYGNTFINKFNLTRLKYCGIGDYNYDEKIGENIFLVIEVVNWRVFDDFYRYIISQDYYVDDYIFSLKDNLHCFVLKFPYTNIINTFLEGKYSKLLAEEDIEKYYLKTYRKNGVEHYTPVYSILTKKEGYKYIFLETLKEDFNTMIELDNDFEYDYPPIPGMEILNYDLNTIV